MTFDFTFFIIIRRRAIIECALVSIPIPSPIPGIESGIELNSHSIPELTPTLPRARHFKVLYLLNT